jgi:hypothetical protein
MIVYQTLIYQRFYGAVTHRHFLVTSHRKFKIKQK